MQHTALSFALLVFETTNCDLAILCHETQCQISIYGSAHSFSAFQSSQKVLDT